MVTAAVADCLALVLSLWAWLDHWERLCSFCCLVVCAGDLAFKADFHFYNKKLHLPSGSPWKPKYFLIRSRVRFGALSYCMVTTEMLLFIRNKYMWKFVLEWEFITVGLWVNLEQELFHSGQHDVIEVKKFSVARKRHIVPWNNLKGWNLLAHYWLLSPH